MRFSDALELAREIEGRENDHLFNHFGHEALIACDNKRFDTTADDWTVYVRNGPRWSGEDHVSDREYWLKMRKVMQETVDYYG